MQSVMVLKTPQGTPVGYVRMDRKADMCVLALENGIGRDAQLFAVEKAGEETRLHPDGRGEIRLGSVPAALVLLDGQGRIRALGGDRTQSRMAAMRVQQRLARERAASREDSVPEMPDVTAARPQEQNEERCISERPEQHAADDISLMHAQQAWPPPPFFPDAQFKDGAWRV